MSGFAQINLARLPAPQVIETPDFEVLLDEMKARFIEIAPEHAAFIELESEPVAKLLEVCAYYRMLDRLEFNDGARASMLALSTGTDLDQLGAYWSVERLVVQTEDTSVTPPIEEILESDEAFRGRIQLSLEGHTNAGTTGAYSFHARSASSDVKDVAVHSPQPGEVVVTVLSRLGTGAASAELRGIVESALNSDDVRPLTDQVTVQSAVIINYEIDAELILKDGPDPQAVLTFAQEQIETYVAEAHTLGQDVTISGIHAALHQPGVDRVNLIFPETDIEVAFDRAAHCPAISVVVPELDA